MSSLNLHQRRPHDPEAILKNTYFDDNGNTIYTVHTPLKLFDSTSVTTISKVVPIPSDGIIDKALPLTWRKSDLDTLPPDGDDKHPTPSHEADGDRSTFEYIAQIEWKILESSKIRFGWGQHSGREVLVKDFLRKKGWGSGGRHRVFTAEDGKEYQWRLSSGHSELVSYDALKTRIATFHPLVLFNSKKNRARLEIFPPGLHMVDEIFVTFIYIEGLLEGKEKSTWA
ncbi:hypothetical protein F5879DRAFT_159096 [Lentinula edodes]|uniref:uncharacterized protein n=1 Tax=Lentinula edodes TaxID=5353 RepID=UPI001E8D0D8B|nr:uncharacterized protein C8R40DRAFT_467122 [Lentinula edodes]KAH7880113.1 hypothetical protein C8R40DRAFT_467122 [Lentinula edodes]KAJ3903360.1 hypothetical protein F5879DRAFT_159096 [Lentinula edodes]